MDRGARQRLRRYLIWHKWDWVDFRNVLEPTLFGKRATLRAVTLARFLVCGGAHCWKARPEDPNIYRHAIPQKPSVVEGQNGGAANTQSQRVDLINVGSFKPMPIQSKQTQRTK